MAGERCRHLSMKLWWWFQPLFGEPMEPAFILDDSMIISHQPWCLKSRKFHSKLSFRVTRRSLSFLQFFVLTRKHKNANFMHRNWIIHPSMKNLFASGSQKPGNKPWVSSRFSTHQKVSQRLLWDIIHPTPMIIHGSDRHKAFIFSCSLSRYHERFPALVNDGVILQLTPYRLVQQNIKNWRYIYIYTLYIYIHYIYTHQKL